LLGIPIKPPAMSVRTADPVIEPEKAVVEAELAQPWLLEPLERERRTVGPGYNEVIRYGRIYRIPVSRRQILAQEDEERRLREQQRLAASRLTLAPQPKTVPDDPQKRHPGAVLEFSVQYEVRK
jgi:hypothetical protein